MNPKEHQDSFTSKSAAVRVNIVIDPPLRRTAVAINSNAVKTTVYCPPRTPKEHSKCLLKDKVTNEEVKVRTGQQSTQNTLNEREHCSGSVI